MTELPPEYVELILERTARSAATARARLGLREAGREAYFKMMYGLTLAEIAELAEAQGNRCAVCRKATRLVVDHDHDTGEIRGMLCNACNLLLGRMGDNADGVMAFLLYLLDPPAAHR